MRSARRSAREFAGYVPDTPKKIAYFGVGGSGIAAALIRPVLPELSPVRLLNGLRLSPGEQQECDFCIFVSYSGDSEEVLNALDRLNPGPKKAACVSSGGQLLREADARGLRTVVLDTGEVPRFALPNLMGAIYGILQACGMATENYVARACAELERGIARIEGRVQQFIEKKELGKQKRFLVGAFSGYESLARRWASQICENAKVEAEAIILPEAFHNLVVPLCEGDHRDEPALLILRDPQGLEAEERWLHAFQATLDAFGRCQAPVVSAVGLRGRGARILGLSLFGDFLSVSLAEVRGVNIRQTQSIDTYKRILREGRDR
ncbi:MAG: SIS domain-containing protein [bacterium JZ-2024 1]